MPRDIFLSRKESGRFRASALFLLIVAFLVLPACIKKQVHLTFEPLAHLNSDATDLPLSVVVRIYQLANSDRFEQADFQSLWKRDREVLDEDLLDFRELTLHPEKPVQLNVDRVDGSEFVAVMALFRRPDGDQWRQIVPMKGWGRIPFKITVGKREIKFIDEK